ncbi:MAG: prepilin-type N-terminal cleavage/methylation domain-containing protein [Desulfobacterales bacterium]|nr:prepilin-type N-terminal cleavage/methylation domain-containing protein [Desulfobacterales bacterium]
MSLTPGKEREPLSESQDGFSLVETICVLVILSIVAVVALVRLPSLTEHTREMEINTLKTHLRYVQNRAMGSEVPWSVRFIDAATYRFQKNGADSNLVPPGADITDAKLNPDNDPLTVNLVGLSLGTSLEGGLSDRINFDKMGSPVLDDGTTGLTADISVKDAAGTALFTVTAYTGFIE